MGQILLMTESANKSATNFTTNSTHQEIYRLSLGITWRKSRPAAKTASPDSPPGHHFTTL
jgi:hypothetical protein